MTWVIALLEKSLDSVLEALGACGAAPGACTSSSFGCKLSKLRERTSFPPCDEKKRGCPLSLLQRCQYMSYVVMAFVWDKPFLTFGCFTPTCNKNLSQ